ncbi:MAG: DUF1302 domain-containing protein [Amphritea sp.]
MNQLALAVRKTNRQRYRIAISAGMVASCLSLASSPAHALNFELDNGVTIDWDTTATYNAQWRQEDQDSDILDFNGLGFLTDDGNRNFDKGDMTQNRVSFTTDVDINKDNYGAFIRARGWYDEVYDGNDDLTIKPFQQDGVDYHKSEIEFLDAFVYGTFDFDERSLSLRAGEQVVNWGESLFMQGGISSAQGPLDATKANAPGVELKDIFLPIGQVYGEVDLSDNASLGAYYQYDWERTRIDAPATYFSPFDAIGEGSVGDTLDVLGLPVAEKQPDEGQWGVALRYVAEELNSTEFGLYYLRYNDFTPAIQLLPPLLGPQLTQEYFEDIDLIGLSFGTVIGDTNVSGEISYRDGQPVQLDIPGAFYFSEAETVQAQVSAIHIFGASAIADNLTFFGELGYNRVLDIDADATGAAAGVNVDDIDGALDNDRGAAGMVARLKAEYFSVTPGLDLAVTATYRNDFNGVSSVPFTYTEGREELGLNVDFTYLNTHGFGASYVAFLTDPEDIIDDDGKLELGHLTADRDYASIYYKYSF